MTNFKFSQKNWEKIVIVTLEGELLSDEVPDFNDKLSATVNSMNRIIVDVTHLQYICSAGMGALIAAHNKIMQSDNGGMVIVGLNNKIERTFNSVGFARFMKYASTVDEAKELLK